MTPAIPTRALLTPSGRPSTITPPPCSSSLLPSLLYASSTLTPLSAPRAPVAPYTLPSPPPLCRPPHDTTSRSAPCAGRDHATAPAPTTAAAAVAAASDYAHYPRLSPEDVPPPTPPPHHAAAALLGQSLHTMDTVKNVLGKMGKRLGEAARKTESLNARDYPRRFPLLLGPLRRSTRDAGLAPTGHCSTEPPPRSHVLPIRARWSEFVPACTKFVQRSAKHSSRCLGTSDLGTTSRWRHLTQVHNTVPPPTPQPDRPVKHPLCRCNPQSSQIDGQIRCTGQKNGLLSCRPSWQLNQYCLQALRKDMAICESSIDIIKDMMLD
uniref:Uncharacterized protein n=1 Tax=Oryza barthii TaxID=65489 RepID=A0A0D3G4Q2_9ORYZ